MSSNPCVETAISAGLSSTDLHRLLNLSREAATAGGEELMRHYGQIASIKSKGRLGDLVTNADTSAESVILDILINKDRDIGILAEERGAIGDQNGLCWCIDPLDGTTNFAHGYPLFATSIGLTYRKQPILGSIEIPFLKESYWAAPNIGAYCNDVKINVSDCDLLENSLLVTGFAYDRQTRIDNNYAEYCWFTHRTRGVRRGGAAAVDLAFVASGRLDGYWERGLAPWDLAAGVALVEHSGGKVTDYRAENFDISTGRIVAAGLGIHPLIVDGLANIKPIPVKYFGNS